MHKVLIIGEHDGKALNPATAKCVTCAKTIPDAEIIIAGFTDIEAASATIAQWLFGIFLVLFLGALIIGLSIGARLTS